MSVRMMDRVPSLDSTGDVTNGDDAIARGDCSDGSRIDSSGADNALYVRVAVPDIKAQRCLQFEQTDTVYRVKQKVLDIMGKELKDGCNYGLYQPPMNGRAGKFLEEERLLRDYNLSGPIGFLEFKYKRRVYKMMHMNPRKLKQLHTKANLKQFLEAVRTSNIEKINKFANKGLDPNFHEHQTGETPLCVSTSLERPRNVIIALFSGGAHLDFRARDSDTPMHRAAARGNYEAMKTLLDLGTSANYLNQWGLTPLYNTVSNNTNPYCVELLLHDHAFIGTTDDQGWAEVHHACKNGCVQHLEHLLFYGADLNIQNHTGNTPLHVCAAHGQESCARVLLFRGCNKNIQNYSNQDAFQVAIISKNKLIADLIGDFTSDQVVPFQEMPKYNDKRRGTPIIQSTYGSLKRSRSDPRLNLSFANSCSDLTVQSYDSSSPSVHSQSSSSSVQYTSRLHQSNSQHQPNNLNQSTSSYSSSCLGALMFRHPSLDSSASQRSMSISSTGSCNGIKALSDEDNDDDSIILKRKHLAAFIQSEKETAPRIVVLTKSPNGFGFVLRGAKSQVHRASVLEFSPSSTFPALQYLERVDAGSMADKAGLKRGDFILEINGKSVINATHESTVRLIQDTKDVLQLKVLTVQTPTVEGTHTHMDGTRTLPNKKKDKISLYTKNVSEKNLNLAAAKIGVDPANKTASIKRFSKKVTAVELEDIFARQGNADDSGSNQSKVTSMDPIGTLNRARSQPSLVSQNQGNGTTSEAIYSNHIETSLPNGLARTQSKTGYISNTKADVHYEKHMNGQKEVLYAVPNKEDFEHAYRETDSGNASGSSGNSVEISPPSTKQPAPVPPRMNSVIIPPPPQHPPPTPPSPTEVVAIASVPTYANISEQIALHKAANKDSPYESSFRPGTDARLSKDPLPTPATASLRRQKVPPQKTSVLDTVHMFEHSNRSQSNTITPTKENTTETVSVIPEQHSVSFVEDQVYENAKDFVKEHPRATVLITDQSDYEKTQSFREAEGTGVFGNAIRQAAKAREQRVKEEDIKTTNNTTNTYNSHDQNGLSPTGNKQDDDDVNYLQMAEKARQQWLKKKTVGSAETPAPFENSTAHVTHVTQSITSPTPPPPPPLPSTQPPLPLKHSTIPTRQTGNNTEGLTGLKPVKPAVPHSERKSGLADLAQVIANKAKQRNQVNEQTGVNKTLKDVKEHTAPRNTILGHHVLNQSVNQPAAQPTKNPAINGSTGSRVHHINGATVDYSNTEYALRSQRNNPKEQRDDVTKDLAELSLSDKLKMFGSYGQNQSVQPSSSTHGNHNRENNQNKSDIPPPMVSSPYSGQDRKNYLDTNGSHTDTVGWLINSTTGKQSEHYAVNSASLNGGHVGSGESQLADVIHIEAIPPPPLFTQPATTAVDYSYQMEHDRASLVSSVSTLSTLSSVEHDQLGHCVAPPIIEERYDDLIAPPPPPADDSYIPPPMGFDNSPTNTMGDNYYNTVLRKGPSTKAIHQWSISDVSNWLDSIGQGQHVPNFRHNRVNGIQLQSLHRDSLIRLGVSKPVDRLYIEQAVKSLC